MPQPILPRSKTNPAGTTRLIQGAVSRLQSGIGSVVDGVTAWLDRQPFTVIQVNTLRVNADFYSFQLDELRLASLDDELDRLINQFLYTTDPRTQRHFLSQYSVMGYERAIADAIDNFDAQLSGEYPVALEQVITSQPYTDRIAVISSRVFEEFNGFTAAMKADLRRVLTTGMTNGDNPLTIARQLASRGDVNLNRAKRIARTEINNAHRQAIYDEDRRASTGFGINTRIMHVSALVPGRTRLSHAQRHGRIVTAQEEAAWYQQDGNAINCLCTPLTVVVDDDGKPISQAFVKRQQERRKVFLESGMQNNCECC